MSEWKHTQTVRATAEMGEIGITEVIAADEAVTQDAWSASKSISFGSEYSGEFLSFLLVSNGGGVQEVTGKLVFFDADPDITTDDNNITIAEAKTIVGIVDVAGGDWFTEGAGTSVESVAYITDTKIPFQKTDTLYVAFYNTLAAGVNGTTEILDLNAWFRRDS